MTAHFEVVATDASQPWHARWIAANGEIVWHTENYSTKRDAEASIFMLAGARTENGLIVGTIDPIYPVAYIDNRTVPDTEPMF